MLTHGGVEEGPLEIREAQESYEGRAGDRMEFQAVRLYTGSPAFTP